MFLFRFPFNPPMIFVQYLRRRRCHFFSYLWQISAFWFFFVIFVNPLISNLYWWSSRSLSFPIWISVHCPPFAVKLRTKYNKIYRVHEYRDTYIMRLIDLSLTSYTFTFICLQDPVPWVDVSRDSLSNKLVFSASHSSLEVLEGGHSWGGPQCLVSGFPDINRCPSSPRLVKFTRFDLWDVVPLDPLPVYWITSFNIWNVVSRNRPDSEWSIHWSPFTPFINMGRNSPDYTEFTRVNTIRTSCFVFYSQSIIMVIFLMFNVEFLLGFLLLLTQPLRQVTTKGHRKGEELIISLLN